MVQVMTENGPITLSIQEYTRLMKYIQKQEIAESNREQNQKRVDRWEEHYAPDDFNYLNGDADWERASTKGKRVTFNPSETGSCQSLYPFGTEVNAYDAVSDVSCH
jgi:hypothetical protein